MSVPFRYLILIVTPMLVAVGGCNKSQPSIAASAPAPSPEPPAAAAQAPGPSEPQLQVQPDVDTIDAFARETTSTVDRYLALFADIHDDATAEKAACDIRSLAAELKRLAAALPNIPLQPDHEAEVTKQLAGLPSRMNSKDVSRVMGDPSLGAKVSPAGTEFLRVWMSLLAEVAKRPMAAMRQSESPK
jgi:hypothetical protein